MRTTTTRVLASCLALVTAFAQVGCAGCDELPVDEENLRGFWYGAIEEGDAEAPALGWGAALLHLAGEIPAFPGETDTFEDLGVLSSKTVGAAGRYRAEDGSLLFEAAFATGFAAPQEAEVTRLTADELTLRLPDSVAGDRKAVLRRGEGCLSSGLWIGYGTYLNAAAFGPDGRLHFLQPGWGYGSTHPAQCQAAFAYDVEGHAIDVAPDNTVLIARMVRDRDEVDPSAYGIYVRSFDADAQLEDPSAVGAEEKLSDLVTTYAFPHLYVRHLGDGTPVVLYLYGSDVHAFHRPAGGAWVEARGTFQRATLVTVVSPQLLSLPDGSLVVLADDAEEGLRFDGSAFEPWQRPPPHPRYGRPTVLEIDDEGGVHGAWHVRRGVNSDPNLDTWDHLLVGRLADDGEGPVWRTGWAGLGKPHRLRVNADGSYDVMIVLRRDGSSPYGFVHVEGSLSPARWRGSYETHKLSGVEQPRLNYSSERAVEYSSERAVEDELRFSFGAFGPGGALFVGGGGVTYTPSYGLLRNPALELQGPQPDSVLSVRVVGEVAGRIELPSLGLSCDGACDLLVPEGELLPATFYSTGYPSLVMRTHEGHGSSLFSMLPDGTAALTVRSDNGGEDGRTVHLEVTFHPRYTEAATLVDAPSAEGPSTPVALAPDGEGGSFALVQQGGL